MLKRASSCLLFLISAIFCGSLPAQEPVYTNYTVEDGLPSNEVYDVFEDSLGYIWFATDHGISRFDGYRFTNYSTGDGLVHNTVFGFFEDQKHRVWMRTFNSALCYMENGRIFPYKYNDSLQKFLGRNFIQNFAIDSAGDLWFMNIRRPLGLYRQDHVSGKIERIRLRPGFNAFIRELGGGVFISGIDMDNGWNEQDDPGDSLVFHDHTWLFHMQQKAGPDTRALSRAARRHNGTYMFSYENAFAELQNGKITRRIFLPAGELIANVDVHADGTYWIGSRGLRQYIPGSDEVLQYYNNMQVNASHMDRRGNCWIATGNRGVFFIADIGMFRHQKLAGELTLVNVCRDKIFAVDKSSAIYHLSFRAGAPDSVSRAFGQMIRGSVVHDLFVDEAKNRIFFSGIICDADEFVRKNHAEDIGKEIFLYRDLDFIRSARLAGNKFLAASNSGWGIFDSTRTLIYDSKKEGFKKFCTAVAADNKGVYWIGTTDGLYFFNNGRTVPYRPDDSLFRQRVTSIGQLPRGPLVVSTRGGGLIILDGDSIYNLLASSGLTSDLCGRLALEDSIIWVCSNNGLNRIAIKREGRSLRFSISRINTFHGLPSNLVNDAVRYKNILLLATGRGLAWFDVHKMKFNQHVPPVYIDVVLANERSFEPGDKLLHNENNLAFSFIGLLYNSPGQVNYRYRLDGYETDWHYTGERTVRYFNLPAGDYRFLVSAMNENGTWNAQPAEMAFSIPLHFSKTWWFRGMVILSALVLIWLAVQYYLRQRKERERITSDMLLAELKTLRSQMKPHFIFNSLNSIQHFILEHDEESAHLYLSRFSNLMRKILENTRQNTISLAREIETLRLYLDLEKLRFGENFIYTIDIAPDVITEAIDIPPMLIQPYAENAIWHGLLLRKDQSPRLQLKFWLEGDELVCVIEDNGIGRKKALEQKAGKQHESTGMKNIEERIDILNRVSKLNVTAVVEDLHDDRGEASGTRVTICITGVITIKDN
ncbi:MAG: putative signal transduction histidine kinase [Bacteroidetes bacterium]|nr:MAG: putative signal transduction histidine kinase [Bacteroidota bacterium]